MRWLIPVLVFCLLSSCQGKQAEVAAVVATGATLKAVQTVRENRAAAQGQFPPNECCVICNECTFPCGDRCVANGTLCAQPKGCACAIPNKTTPIDPERRLPDPSHCPSTHFPSIIVY